MHRLVEARITWYYSVIVTLAPLPGADAARWLLKNSRETVIPEALVQRLEKAANPEREGVDICAGLIREISKIPGISGVNLLTLGNPESVIAVIESSGL